MKFTLTKLIVILGSAVAIAVASNAFGQRRAPGEDAVIHDQWEYIVISGGTTNVSSTTSQTLRKDPSGSFGREWFPLEMNMDKLGGKGWELVTVLGTTGDPVYFFKRRK